MALTALPSMVTFMASAWISVATLSSVHASVIAVSAFMELEGLVLEITVLHLVVLNLLRKKYLSQQFLKIIEIVEQKLNLNQIKIIGF